MNKIIFTVAVIIALFLAGWIYLVTSYVIYNTPVDVLTKQMDRIFFVTLVPLLFALIAILKTNPKVLEEEK